MHRVRSSTTTAVPTPRRLRSLWRLRVGAVAGLGLATTLALLPNAPAFGAGRHHRRPDPPLQAAHVVSLTRGGKPVLSNQPADYIPATISGHKVVIDPRSSVGGGGPKTDPSCSSPPGEPVVNPLDFPEEAVEEVSGGLWDCPAGLIDPRSGSPGGSGFVASIDAVKATPPVSKLSKKSLYAISVPADAGSVKTTTVKVNGKRVKVFTYRVTIPTDPNAPRDAFPEPGWQLLAASTEPHAHLLISATTPLPPSGTIADPDGHVWHPVRYLTAMLKAGASKTPRAG
jgi:hypothetical protein